MTTDPVLTGDVRGPAPDPEGTSTTGRFGLLAGIAGIGLFGVALLLPGAPVTSDEPVGRVADTIARHHGSFGVSVYLGGLGLVALIVFAAAIRARPLPGAEVAAVAVLAAALLILIGMTVTGGVAVQPDVASRPEVVRAAVDTGNVLVEMAKLPFAAMILALLPRRPGTAVAVALRGSGVLAAVIAAATALPGLLASSGVWQFGGVVDLAGSVPALGWIVAWTSVVTIGRT